MPGETLQGTLDLFLALFPAGERKCAGRGP
jgi:hypothetical protein